MVVRALSQFSFFHPEIAAPACLVEGTVSWLLARFESRLFPSWALAGWTGGDPRGRPAWPATVLMKLLILRWSNEGMSRRASVREADRNIEWRAAMGLEIGGSTPSEKTIRKFEKFLRKRHPEAGVPRYLLLHEHWVRLCLEDGDIISKAVWAMDSTPMWCYGAVLDTVRLLGDGVSGLIASVAVTVGNKHDGAVAHRLVRRAKELCRHIELVLADTAYGGAELRYLLHGSLNVDVIAPPPPQTALRDGQLGRSHIEIDFNSNTATCAAGVETSQSTLCWSSDYNAYFRRYKWPKEACDRCSRRKGCRGKQTGGHRVALHPFEEELRAARRLWNTPGIREIYRARSLCERLVNQITRHGGRRARAWGLAAARMQVHVIAMTRNLALLARRLAETESLDHSSKAA